MKRMSCVLALLMLGFASPASAQMGMGQFKNPSFTKVFHPVIGKGAQYETTTKIGPDSKTHTMEMGIVGKETVDGIDGYWMQTVMQGSKGTMVTKALLTSGDVQVRKIVFQQPGQTAMEMPMNPNVMQKQKAEETMQDWHSVGTEAVTVPAGTFSCEHWKNDKTGSEVWASDKISPFGMVKEVSKDHSMVLVKVLSDYPDKITGPVQKFDPMQMMQQMQQQKQQNP